MKQWWIVGAIIVVVAIIAFVMVNKKQPATEEATTAPAAAPATPEPAADPQEAYLAENAKKPGWTTTESGLQYFVEKAVDDPAAVKPAPGSEVTINYEGKLIDGTVFDSSYARDEPITFPLSNLIKGWQEAVPLMKVGEIYQIVLPASIGYGSRGAPPSIPGGATLLFKIELLKAPTPAQ